MYSFDIDHFTELNHGTTHNFANAFCIECAPCIEWIHKIWCVENLWLIKKINWDQTLIHCPIPLWQFHSFFFNSLTIKLIFRCLYALKRVWTASLVEFTFEFHPVTTSVVFQLRLNFGLSQSLCGSSKGIRKLSPRGVRNWKFIKCTLGVTVGLITFKCTAALPVIVNQLSG